jgi:galactokinase
MVALVAGDQLESFAQSVRRAYYEATGTQPIVNAVHAAAGAGVMDGSDLAQSSQR